MNRWARSTNDRTNPVADAVENARCDALAQGERQEARAAAQERRATNAARTQQEQAAAAELASIRRRPEVPELGGTSAEARVLCERQRGAFSVNGESLACLVGGLPIFACATGGARLVRCDGYYEDADLTASRRTVEERLGPPETETVADGFRVFSWKSSTVLMTMYPHGVRLSTILPSTPAPVSSGTSLGF